MCSSKPAQTKINARRRRQRGGDIKVKGREGIKCGKKKKNSEGKSERDSRREKTSMRGSYF